MCTFFLEAFMNLDFFDLAFFYANVSFYLNEVPVGAVIVKDNQVISYGFNKKELTHSSINHAEIIAIEMAQKKLNNWRLTGCDMYVTLDPCPMCASAIKQSRISNVYSALSNSDANNSIIINQIFEADSINPKVNFTSDLNSDISKKLLQDFFSKQREK